MLGIVFLRYSSSPSSSSLQIFFFFLDNRQININIKISSIKLFLAFCIKLFSVQHYLKNCSLSFLHKLFSVHYLKNCSLFSHKTPPAIVFSKFKNQICMLLKAKSVCFFLFKFHNNWICFSTLIKSVSTLIKVALYTSCLLYIQICLLHS